MVQEHYSQFLKTGQHIQPLDLILRSPITVLAGVNEDAADALRPINIHSVFDLASSRVFKNAHELSFPSRDDLFRETNLVASDVIEIQVLEQGFDQQWAVQPIVHLEGIGARNEAKIRSSLSVETIRDLALWPPFIAAREMVGRNQREEEGFRDEGIPHELVPKFSKYASEKSFYSIYVIDEGNDERSAQGLPELNAAVSLHNPRLIGVNDVPRTGAILRYEQSWTPVALTLGNLLHSLALAPGESTRIAIIDWTRRQGVRTSEDITQLEALSNSLMQTRSISEVTRSVAREAQSGFSSMNSNSNVSNNAYSSYGLQNAEQALSAAAVGAVAGAGGGAIGGGAIGAGIGAGVAAFVGGAGALIGAGAGLLVGAGSGALVGGTSGGVGAFLGMAEFGSSQGSGSTTSVDAVTTTSSTGVRDVALEMAQNIDDRTHQHASTSRNRHASIVQEVSQQETEQVSTRVVTNYNHMYALTIQYFEVVQVYNVRTTLVQKQDCLYIPFLPIDWNIDLVRLFRLQILEVSLTAEIFWSLLTTEKTVLLASPSYHSMPEQVVRERLQNTKYIDALARARIVLNTFVSNNPLDGWRLPDNLFFSWVWGIAGVVDVDHELVFHLRDGRRRVFAGTGQLSEFAGLSLGSVTHVTYERTVKRSEKLSFPQHRSFTFVMQRSQAISWEHDSETISFSAHFLADESHLMETGKLVVPVLSLSRSMAMADVVTHLNENTEHYSSHVLRKKNNPLVHSVLTSYSFRGKPLINQVDHEPVAISGNQLVFLLHDSQKSLSKTSQQYKVGSITRNSNVPVGTGGVFAEAVRGRANSAEKLDITRFWDWQESPIPIVAPEIAPIQTGSRLMAADIRPGSQDASTVPIMSPQSLPAPQGLPNVLQAVSTQMFRDMSGIQQTALLAQKSLEEAVEGATTTGAQSADNLKQGLAFTKELIGKIVDMNSQFAKTIAEGSFGIVGMAKGGQKPSKGALVDKGTSYDGALLNAARRLDTDGSSGGRGASAGAAGESTPGGTPGSGSAGDDAGSGPSVVPNPPSGGTPKESSTGTGNSITEAGRAFQSLERQVLEHAAGIAPGGDSFLLPNAGNQVERETSKGSGLFD